MSYQVVGYPFCPFVQRVLITLNEKAVDYESIWLDPHSELPEWFNDWSPLGKVPVMKVTTGEVLFESMAIVEYVEELHKVPSIYSKNAAKRALQRAWAGVADLVRHADAQSTGEIAADYVVQQKHFQPVHAALQQIDRRQHKAAGEQRPGQACPLKAPGPEVIQELYAAAQNLRGDLCFPDGR